MPAAAPEAGDVARPESTDVTASESSNVVLPEASNATAHVSSNIAPPVAGSSKAALPADRSPLARLRRHLVVVSGGLTKRAEPGVFADWVTARVTLSETHPVLALLLASFSSDLDARVQWRLVLGAGPDAVALGRPVVCKVIGGKSRSLTVYGVTAPLVPGEYPLCVQVSANPAASLAVHPSASTGAEYLRFLLFELL